VHGRKQRRVRPDQQDALLGQLILIAARTSSIYAIRKSPNFCW